jgi:hypothetical protein
VAGRVEQMAVSDSALAELIRACERFGVCTWAFSRSRGRGITPTASRSPRSGSRVVDAATGSISTRSAVLDFDRFDLECVPVRPSLFLRAKRLPESQVDYDEESGAYTVSTDARHAPLLDASLAAVVREELPLAGHLFDYQAFIVGQALAARRYACWADTGLGRRRSSWSGRARCATALGAVC